LDLTRAIAFVWRLLPAALAFALLLLELWVPWSVPHFVTQDGPSHVYGATVLWDLVLHHKSSVYAPVYTVQRTPLPNWTSTLLLAIAAKVAGIAHAEQVFVTIAFLIGFLVWSFALHVIVPHENWFTPVANLLYQTFFLWIGYFNFYLGMALMPLAIAMYAQRQGVLSTRRAAGLAAVLILLFATHLVAALAATVALFAIGAWVHIAVPLASREAVRTKQIRLLLASAAPVIILTAAYASSIQTTAPFDPQISFAWHNFPMHVFLTAADGPYQRTVWKVLLLYAALAAALLRKREWQSTNGGLVLAAGALFAAYLLAPDQGFGGMYAKFRLSWAFFILAGLIACSASRLRPIRPLVAILLAWFMVPNTLATQRIQQAMSNLAQDYLAIVSRIDPRSTLVRLRFPAPELPRKYGYDNTARDPAFHLEALEAARKQSIDYTDYEAPSHIFPVVYKTYVDRGQQAVLWGLEGPGQDAAKQVHWLGETLPKPIDYVLVTGDIDSPGAIEAKMATTIADLDSTMRPVAISPGRIFRLYRSVTPGPKRF